MRFKKILFTVIAGYLVLTVYFLAWSYYHGLAEAEKAALMRLRGITNAIALQVDGDQHERLFQKNTQKDAIIQNNQDSNYAHIHYVLEQNYTANMLKSPIYTLVFDSLSNSYVFGVTSSINPYFRHTYNSYPESIMSKYNEGGTISMYKDEFGMWLTAFSVIKNSHGNVVALVLADEPFDQFLALNRSTLIKNLFVALAVMLVLFFALLRILQPMLQRQRRDQEAIARAHAQVVQLDQFRKEMIANVSHDLRTPIASILGFAETLYQKRTTLSPEDQEKYLLIVSKEAKRVNNMISELFDLSKLESGQIELKKEDFNLTEIAQDILYSCSEQAKARQIRLLTDFQHPIPLVSADIYWIDRVLQNLLGNALKYVNDNGLIKFTIFQEDQRLTIKVCNSGIPIAPEHLPFVFDRYFKATTGNNDSTGLGLAITKKIVELHDGRIWAEVEEDITTFRITLPLTP
jgi:signal transduction histidine kinase